MKNQKGFTFIEVMATLIILVILTGVMVPTFQGVATRGKLRTSARTLVTDIRYTQQLAIANKTQAKMYFNKDEGTFNITQSRKTIKSGSLIDGVVFENISFDNNLCIFAATGSPNGGSLHISSQDKCYTITVKIGRGVV